MKNLLIKIIAIVCAIIGIFYLVRNFSGHIWYLSEVIKGHYPGYNQELWMVIITIGAFIILLLRPVAGYGLFNLKRWGKNLAIGVLAMDFIIRAIGFIHISTYSLRHPEFTKVAENALKSIAEAQARGVNVHVAIISMIPSYAIAIVSLISVILLLRIKLKE